jgi:SHS2 domain-containing protein
VYRWVEHTSELELELKAASECELLSESMEALRELLDPERAASAPEPVDEPRPGAQPPPKLGAEAPLERGAETPLERRVVRATAPDRPALLAAWLEELLFLAESSGFIPLLVEELSLEDQQLTATVAGRLGRPRPLVKAVTYHRLEFEPAERGYRGRVVFDV